MKNLGRICMVAAACAMVSGSALAVTTDDQFLATNRIGIRTLSPAQVLHLFDNVSGTVRFRLENSEGAVDMLTDNNGFAIINNGNQNLTLSQGGNLGIGTTNPSQRIHLNTNTAGSTRFRLQQNEGFVDFVTDNGQMQMWVNNSPKMFINPTGEVGIGTSTPGTELDVNGEITTEVLQITGGSDLSETFDVNAEGAVPGMVVSIDVTDPGKLVVAEKAYDKTVAGIISGAGGLNTGMRMGQAGTMAYGGHPVALTGRVYCLVDATDAAIEPGDMLTTSNTAGHAMKVLDHGLASGSIIGKAMTPLAQGEKGLVLVLVSLQ